jgi:superfamily II DNA or RNA helicase
LIQPNFLERLESFSGEKTIDIASLIARTTMRSRPYQQLIVAKAVDLFCNQQLRSILIDSLTGSGKTVMSLLVAKALQAEPPRRVRRLGRHAPLPA